MDGWVGGYGGRCWEIAALRGCRVGAEGNWTQEKRVYSVN